MLLHLKDGRTVEIFRQNCGYYFHDKYKHLPDINWNINPVEIVNDEKNGFFCICEWGNAFSRDDRGELIYHPENIQELVFVKSVVSITETHKWERKDSALYREE